MRMRMLIMALAAALLAAPLLGGCSSHKAPEAKPLEEPPAAPAKTPEQIQAEKEAAAKAAEEAAAKRKEEEVKQTFGTPAPPPSPPPVQKAPEGLPFDQVVPPLPAEPTVRVAVLSDAGQPSKGEKVALIIGTYQKKRLENELGMTVKIAYISSVTKNITRQSVIRYRPKFLKAAVAVASVLPAEQRVEPMTPAEEDRLGADLLVFVGRDYR